MVNAQLLATISILILVVVELSGRIHDKGSLHYPHEELFLLQYPLSGRFGVIHSTNVILLFLGYALILQNAVIETTSILIFLLFVLFVMAAILPYLEIPEYDDMYGFGAPSSTRIHFLTIVSAGILWPGLTLVFVIITPQHPVINIIPDIIGIVILYVGTSKFIQQAQIDAGTHDWTRGRGS